MPGLSSLRLYPGAPCANAAPYQHIAAWQPFSRHTLRKRGTVSAHRSMAAFLPAHPPQTQHRISTSQHGSLSPGTARNLLVMSPARLRSCRQNPGKSCGKRRAYARSGIRTSLFCNRFLPSEAAWIRFAPYPPWPGQSLPHS